jgi:bacteriorhodopsin
MPDLSPFGYNVVSNLLSLTVATMGAAAVFFFFAPRVIQKYRPAMIVTGLVTLIACYHYYKIGQSFEAAFTLSGGVYTYNASQPFNDFYRYADWLLTVPLLMVELVAVMALAKKESAKLLSLLIPAVVLMIVTGYPGEAAISQAVGGGEASAAAIWGWFAVSMLFFVIVLGVLFTKLTDAINRQPEEAQGLLKFARIVVLVTWSFYPVAYVIGALGGKTAAGVVGLQVGYTIADITAKAGFGVLIYFIARRKSELEGETAPSGVPATA